jgi:hypothetical protein
MLLEKRGRTTGDILREVSECVVAAANRHGNCWDVTAEAAENPKRLRSVLQRLERESDLGDGEVPDWLPADLEDKWADLVTAGKRPTISSNRFGIFVRPSHEGVPRATAVEGGAAKEVPPEGVQPTAPEALKPRQKRPAPHLFVLKRRGIIDPSKIPQREWLGGGRFYQRRMVSMTIAPGDYGKTTLSILDAVVLTTGRMLLDEQPKEMLRVWYHNGEDTAEELDRRFAAVCLHYGIPFEEIADIIITNAQEVPLRVAYRLQRPENRGQAGRPHWQSDYR